MTKKNYERPSVEVIMVNIEKGFAGTGTIQAEKPFLGSDLHMESEINTDDYTVTDGNGLWDNL